MFTKLQSSYLKIVENIALQKNPLITNGKQSKATRCLRTLLKEKVSEIRINTLVKRHIYRDGKRYPQTCARRHGIFS